MLGVYVEGNIEQLYPDGAGESVLFKRIHTADLNPDAADVMAGMAHGEPCLVRDWGALQQRPDLLLPLTEWDTAGLMVHVRGVGVAHVLTVRTICRSYQPVVVVPWAGSEYLFSVRDEWGEVVEPTHVRSEIMGCCSGFIDFSHGQVIRLADVTRGARVKLQVYYGARDSVCFEVRFNDQNVC